MTNSIARWQAKNLATSPLTNPGFFLSPVADQSFPANFNLPLNLQFNNNSSDGYSDVQVEYSGPGAVYIQSANPELIGTIGAASAGFTNTLIGGGAGGPLPLTATLTGELLGDVYQSVVTFNVTFA